jgi:pyruvate/2-oxoglutarate dehydrogenase complex dihydrolipoamide acyltransferase (E2) component
MTSWKSALLGAGLALAAVTVPFAQATAQIDVPLNPTMGADPAPATPPAAAPAPETTAPPAPAQKATRTSGSKDAYLYIGWPNNGETVRSPFKVWFGMRNFGVAPAGVTKQGTGHHHLLVDTDLKTFDEPIPNDKRHLHFGKGQTETVLELPPGKHTLQLVLGDADHVPFDPPIMSKKVTITVRGEPPQVSAR